MTDNVVQFGQKGHVYRLLPKAIFDRFDLVDSTRGRLDYSPDNWYSVAKVHKRHAGEILVCTDTFATTMQTYYDQYTQDKINQTIAMVRIGTDGWTLYLNTHWAVELTSADFEAGHIITSQAEFVERGFSFAGNPNIQTKWRTKVQQSLIINADMFPVRNPCYCHPEYMRWNSEEERNAVYELCKYQESHGYVIDGEFRMRYGQYTTLD